MHARRLLRFLPLSISLGVLLIFFGHAMASTELTFPLTTVGQTTAISYTYKLLESVSYTHLTLPTKRIV